MSEDAAYAEAWEQALREDEAWERALREQLAHLECAEMSRKDTGSEEYEGLAVRVDVYGDTENRSIRFQTDTGWDEHALEIGSDDFRAVFRAMSEADPLLMRVLVTRAFGRLTPLIYAKDADRERSLHREWDRDNYGLGWRWMT